MMTGAQEFAQRQETAAETDAMVSGLRNGPREDTVEEKTELLEQLTDDDLNTSTDTLANLATKDFPSANFSEEESTEFRHFLDVMLERKHAAHPHQGQIVTGPLREWVHDDPTAGQRPVSKADKLKDETFRHGVAARITKGKDGSLLRQALQSIRQSVLRRDDTSDGGGGILGRLRR